MFIYNIWYGYLLYMIMTRFNTKKGHAYKNTKNLRDTKIVRLSICSGYRTKQKDTTLKFKRKAPMGSELNNSVIQLFQLFRELVNKISNSMNYTS